MVTVRSPPIEDPGGVQSTPKASTPFSLCQHRRTRAQPQPKARRLSEAGSNPASLNSRTMSAKLSLPMTTNASRSKWLRRRILGAAGAAAFRHRHRAVHASWWSLSEQDVPPGTSKTPSVPEVAKSCKICADAQ